MRVSTAYFVGAGTVVVAIAAGLGGGLLLGDIMSPQQPKHPSSEVTRLEQRASPQPIQAMNGASQPVPYLPTAQVPATIAEPQSQPPAQQASAPAAEPKRQPEPSANANTAAQPAAAAPPPPAATEQTAARERAAPEDSLTKARDADLKRDARRAEDRRKAERRQQWAERRKLRPRDGDDLGDVEASVRQATESRPVFGRDQSRSTFNGEPGFGRIRIFESDN
jgi:hypothetical protein